MIPVLAVTTLEWITAAGEGGTVILAILGFIAWRTKWFGVKVKQPLHSRIDGDLAVQLKGRRYSATFDDERHGGVVRRLDGHEAEIRSIWVEMRKEDSATRATLATAVRDFDTTLARLDGTLDGVHKTQQLILTKLLKDVQ